MKLTSTGREIDTSCPYESDCFGNKAGRPLLGDLLVARTNALAVIAHG